MSSQPRSSHRPDPLEQAVRRELHAEHRFAWPHVTPLERAVPGATGSTVAAVSAPER